MKNARVDAPFVRVGLIVTGETEERCLPELFGILTAQGNCHFRVIRRVGQRSPIKSEKRLAKMVGSGKKIPNRDADDIGAPARKFLRSQGDYVILVDDLERDRASNVQGVFERYRAALDTMLSQQEAPKAAVHFLVNMLEAYYFADAKAVNRVLGTDLEDFDGDVETIGHPKNRLKGLHPTFDEKTEGPRIVAELDVMHVLCDESSCAALRTMLTWAHHATGSTARVPPGRLFERTESQIESLMHVKDAECGGAA